MPLGLGIICSLSTRLIIKLIKCREIVGCYYLCSPNNNSFRFHSSWMRCLTSSLTERVYLSMIHRVYLCDCIAVCFGAPQWNGLKLITQYQEAWARASSNFIDADVINVLRAPVMLCVHFNTTECESVFYIGIGDMAHRVSHRVLGFKIAHSGKQYTQDTAPMQNRIDGAYSYE